VTAPKYYVLIHFKVPQFISGPEADDIDPMSYDTFEAADAAGKAQSAAKVRGYSVIGWDPEQGGEGLVTTLASVPSAPEPVPAKPATRNVGEGWASPALANRAHYFSGGRSLCGGWALFSEPDPRQKLGDAPRADDCKACWRAAKKLERG